MLNRQFLAFAFCVIAPSVALSATPAQQLMQSLQASVTRHVDAIGACRIEVAGDSPYVDGRALILECVGDPAYDAQVIRAVTSVDRTDIDRYATSIWAPGWRDAIEARAGERRHQIVPFGPVVSLADAAFNRPASYGDYVSTPDRDTDPFLQALQAAEPDGGAPIDLRRVAAAHAEATANMRAHTSMPTPVAAAQSVAPDMRSIYRHGGRVSVHREDYARLQCHVRTGTRDYPSSRTRSELDAFPSDLTQDRQHAAYVLVDARRFDFLVSHARDARARWNHPEVTIEEACG